MTHTTFVIFYIVLNIIYLYILGSAGKDIKKSDTITRQTMVYNMYYTCDNHSMCHYMVQLCIL